MSVFKKFLSKTKTNAKFKMAGPGHKLNESSSSSSSSGGNVDRQQHKRPANVEPTDAARQAAQAALARSTNQKKETKPLTAVQAKVRRELEAEKKSEHVPEMSTAATYRPKEVEIEEPPHLSVTGVYFRCPVYDDSNLALSKEEWKYRLKDFISLNLEDDKGQAACLTIKSCNFNRVEVEACVNMLTRCLSNIIENPTKEEYRKIRFANKTFQSKVMPILGAIEFLQAAGYEEKKILNEKSGEEEECLVISQEAVENMDKLVQLRENLAEEERIELVLDRNVQFLTPAQGVERFQLSNDFFTVTSREIKKEQQSKSDAAEKELQLRTHEMREHDKRSEHRIYKYALIRVRFPDNTYLQGTFSVKETVSDIFQFVREHLEVQFPFVLTTSDGHKLGNISENTLAAANLVPAILLNFQWDQKVIEEGSEAPKTYLKDTLALLMQSL